MSPSPSRDNYPPFAAPTPGPPTPQLRRSVTVGSSWAPKHRRQHISDQQDIDEAKFTCQNLVDNAVQSCWPTNTTSIAQGDWTQFVWNSRLPQFTQINLVNIGLYRADSNQQVLLLLNVTNPFGRAGFVTVQSDDSWWGADGPNWPDHNVSFPFYFMIVRSDQTFDKGIPQATFTAVQTNFPSSILSSMSSSSAASAASQSSALAASSSLLGSGTASASHGSGTSGLQNANSASSFPHWAIAVIVVLGFLAMVAFIILTFLILRAMRRRRGDTPSRRGSMGSQSPMITNIGGSAISPTQPSHSLNVGTASTAFMGRAASSISPDGASAHSDGPFSGADAAVMAEAFRKALRKPDFADRPVEEGESPDQGGEAELMNRELAEEGRDIRSVGSSRGVKLETLSESGDTARESQL